LTAYAGIGDAIASAIREIVMTGSLGKLEKLRSAATTELTSISAFPRLDPKRVLRIYKKLGIHSVEELREQLENGEIEKHLGLRMAQHVRQGVTETHAMLSTGRTTFALRSKNSFSKNAACVAPKLLAIIDAAWTSPRNWPLSSRQTICLA